MSSLAPDDTALSIDPVETTHCAALAALIHRAFAGYRGVLVPDSGAHGETPDTLAAALLRGRAYRAVMDGEPVGCLFTETCPDRIYLGRLAVDPAWRRRGIGQALMAAAEVDARAAGMPRMELGVRLMLHDNIRLFQRAGYVITGQRSHPGFAAPTYHVMEKRLV